MPGLIDRYGRRLDYLRLSVTDRCNLRCIYCLPPGGVALRPPSDILTYEEILRVVECALELGVTRVRVTGGEPLVRQGLLDFLSLLSRLPGLADLSLTTNGTLLPGLAGDLRQAGVARLNLSLDSLDADRFARITRGGRLGQVLRGLDEALLAGFAAVKLNVVVVRGFNLDEVPRFAALTLEAPVHVRFIELMPLGEAGPWSARARVPTAQVRAVVERELGPLEPAPGVAGAGPAEYGRLKGGQGAVGFIAPMSRGFCASCNRLRLQADGALRPCLAGGPEVPLGPLLRSGCPEPALRRALERAASLKPRSHRLAAGERGEGRVGGEAPCMARIGG
ncbi:MAG: GTP 3',8-cyclase MoaA [Acetobacteraceae bacterium]|nr:GTP 3',8-cyclase MoaA [Acetobacteraceae bacterium]